MSTCYADEIRVGVPLTLRWSLTLLPFPWSLLLGNVRDSAKSLIQLFGSEISSSMRQPSVDQGTE